MLNKYFEEAKSESLEKLVPSFKQNLVTEEQVEQIINTLITKHKGLEPKHVLIAMILLFLKGAATRTTPSSLSVEINGITITKQDLENATNAILNHKYIRRIAEAIALQIGLYAEVNGLDGELAGRINKLISENNYRLNTTEPPLTQAERAWCSSYSQSIKDLKNHTTERVVQWLNIDYTDRFSKKTRTIPQKK
jgi:hypothetical protein